MLVRLCTNAPAPMVSIINGNNLFEWWLWSHYYTWLIPIVLLFLHIATKVGITETSSHCRQRKTTTTKHKHTEQISINFKMWEINQFGTLARYELSHTRATKSTHTAPTIYEIRNRNLVFRGKQIWFTWKKNGLNLYFGIVDHLFLDLFCFVSHKEQKKKKPVSILSQFCVLPIVLLHCVQDLSTCLTSLSLLSVSSRHFLSMFSLFV